ncbi:hypothetical protein [Holospora elegans]|nr:hypothetical protein [Holospora elegans]
MGEKKIRKRHSVVDRQGNLLHITIRPMAQVLGAELFYIKGSVCRCWI